MATFECPSCGTENTVEQFRRDATEFCPVCDFPLFWATIETDEPEEVEELVAAGMGGISGDSTRMRLPGAGGRQTLGGITCPNCSELNSPDHAFCSRCGFDLHAPLEVEEAELVVEEKEWEPTGPGWLYLIARLMLAALIIAAIVWRISVS